MLLCQYGCGNPGIFKFKNETLCCSKRFDGCPVIRQKRVETRKAKNWKHSEESKKLIGEKSKQKIYTEEYRQKLSNAFKGRKLGPQTEEHKQKLSKSRKGKTPWNKGLTSEDPRIASYASKQQGISKNVGLIPWNKGLKKQEALEILDRADPIYSDFKKYRNRVSVRTRKNYELHESTINPNGLKLGKCGVDGAYQIDHIITVRQGFEQGIPVEVIAAAENLRVIPWLENVQKYDGKGIRKNSRLDLQ
jgi:hypothetical protein